MFGGREIDLAFLPDGAQPSDGHLLLYFPRQPERGPQPSDAVALDLREWVLNTAPATARLQLPEGSVRTVRCLSISVRNALGVLCGFQGVRSRVGVAYPASLRIWSLAEKFALELASRGYILPTIRVDDQRVSRASWALAMLDDKDQQRFNAIAAALPGSACAAGQRATPAELLRDYLDAVGDALIRGAASRVVIPLKPGAVTTANVLERRILTALTAPINTVATTSYTDSSLLISMAAWSAPVLKNAAHALRLQIQLSEPPPDDLTQPWRLDYSLASTQDPTIVIAASDVWSTSNADHRGYRVDLLRALAEAARVSPAIDKSLSQATPTHADLTTQDAWRFVSEEAPVLARWGVNVQVPEALLPSSRQHMRPRIRIMRAHGQPILGDAPIRLEGVTAYRWEVALGDDVLTLEEFKALTAEKAQLVRRRGQWVTIDPALLERGEEIMRSADGTLLGGQALSALASGAVSLDGQSDIEVVADADLRGLMQWLTSGKAAEEIPEPTGFIGTLRPYQKRGVGWLQTMEELGIGGCLADEMGLGKTIQVIALLLSRPRTTLIVCPTSVIVNWQRELTKFAPDLTVAMHHGPERATDPAALERIASSRGTLITNYALLRQDRHILEQISWERVVLDEAQAIKNVGSQQTRAVRHLLNTVARRTPNAVSRLALTGTPVENRLSELWSILDFCNPQLLGSLAGFNKTFILPIERWQDEEVAQKLQRRSQPFILRRRKSEMALTLQIPEKNEITVACTLTREQAGLYQAQIDHSMNEIASAQGMARRGRVLRLITTLKQICNHPAHFLREPDSEPDRSGKLTRLTEMLEEVVESGDKALVFTQYRQMGDRLLLALRKKFGNTAAFIHGGLTTTARMKIVDAFQSEPTPQILILSLKAGGLGLNLTAASHVFHFDRWWNPAVEDQATDRVHRIGQTRVVQVYKMVTAGTLEEAIARMLEQKKGLADKVLGGGERWLTELNDAELRELVQLAGGETEGWDTETAGGAH